MIPLKMQLKNFLSYGPDIQTIDFSSYPLICLSGKNGHGKSALLDAITWAVWGQARKVAATGKADQGLLHLGQATMMVSFDFVCNGNTYRIKREFAHLYGKPYTSLEFGVVDGETVRPLTDKTIRGTQAVIEETLHVSFDSFVNSAFLRQGYSNEFSKKTPKERKEILSAILGLDTYESIRKKAMEKNKELQSKKLSISLMLEKTELEVAHKQALALKQTQIQQQLDLIRADVEDNKTKQVAIEQLKKEYAQVTTEYQISTSLVAQLQEQYQQGAQAVRAQVTQWRKIRKQQASAHLLPQLEAQSRALTQAYALKQKEMHEAFESREQLLKTQQLLNALIFTYQTDAQKELLNKTLVLEQEKHKYLEAQKTQQELSKSIKELTASKKELEKAITTRQQTLVQLRKDTQDHAAIERQFEKRKEYYHTYVSKRNALKTALDELDQKVDLVAHEDDPSCPLCEQNLSASRKRFLKTKFAKEQRLSAHQYARLISLTKRLKEIVIDQHATLEQLKKSAQQLAVTTSEIEQMNVRLEQVTTELQIKEDELAVVTLALQERASVAQQQEQALVQARQATLLPTNNPEYVQLTTQVADLEKKAQCYDQLQQETRQLMHELQEITTLINQLSNSSVVAEQQSERKEAISNLITDLKRIKREISQHHEQQQVLSVKKIQIQASMAQEAELIAQMQSLTTQKEQVLHELGTITAQLHKLTLLEQEVQAHQKTLEQLAQRADDLAIIAQATGKDGVQALLIEETIPEIEQEANYLLGKLTNNQAHVFIESLKDLKKGGAKETLDIKISDSLGIRPYELFSGGEAFRIDFALRIAISKLLARRAGTSLQTLIIDEGFGSQDEEGLAHIMDALHKIQDDFAKIIIVSHLPSMKEQFPVHFVIEKGPRGSKVRVVEND